MKKGLRKARRDAMYQQVVARVTREAGDLPPANRCLHYARHTADVIRERGVRAILQAGSCTWPRVRPENDDGKVMTHFGYVWSPRELGSIQSMLAGNLPEMHVWVALPSQGEIVDMTTALFPEQAKKTCDMDWPGDPPPQYLWTTADRLPRGVTYEPVPEAIAYVLDLLAHAYERRRSARVGRTPHECGHVRESLRSSKGGVIQLLGPSDDLKCPWRGFVSPTTAPHEE